MDPWTLGLFHENPRALDLLAAQGAQKAGHQAVHQLEIRGEGGRGLLRAVEDLFLVALRVDRGPGPAVDEDELRLQDEALALHVGADRHYPTAAYLVDHFLLALHEPRARVRGEQHRAGDDEGVLVFLADLLPEVDVGEDALERL